MKNVSNLIPFTTFGILKGMKAAGGKPTTFPTLNEFITWARFTSGDSFATESEAKTLLEVREHGFEVVKGYITSGVVWIADLNADECSACNACVICGHQIPPARFGSNLCSGDCRVTKSLEQSKRLNKVLAKNEYFNDAPCEECGLIEGCHVIDCSLDPGYIEAESDGTMHVRRINEMDADEFSRYAGLTDSEMFHAEEEAYRAKIRENDPVVIQDDGSGNQVTASGRVLR